MEIIYVAGILIFLGIVNLIVQMCTPVISQGMCECEECE